MNSHEVHVFENGSASIKNLRLSHGETMHSSMGAELEAHSVYIAQTQLKQKLLASQPGALVLYDIGMGIATNALAALELALQTSQRKLHLVSFENDLEGLNLALSHCDLFPTQTRHRETLLRLMRDGHWRSACGQVFWELKLGNFENTPLDTPPEVIFYDFYSPKSSPELWTLTQFSRLFQSISKSAVLATYSAATSVRSGLLLAGFYVGRGAATELKSETTLASTQITELKDPLGPDFLVHVDRSSRGFPSDLNLEPQEIRKYRTTLERHPQFAKHSN